MNGWAPTKDWMDGGGTLFLVPFGRDFFCWIVRPRWHMIPGVGVFSLGRVGMSLGWHHEMCALHTWIRGFQN